MSSINKKYGLPSKIKVVVSKTPEKTYMATFPELPGCLTEADNIIDLLYQVNDAIFTYFDIERKELKNIDFLYAPPPNFLKNIEDTPGKNKSSSKRVEFHIPYAFV
jgi:predicted RNase H-like HicB family nuclease